MKNLVRILTLILILALCYAVYLSFKIRNDKISIIGEADNNNLATGQHSEAFEKLISRDLTTDYPSSYMELMLYYNDIVKYLYGGTATVEEIEVLLSIQRKLYSEAILILNTYEEQLAYAIEEIQKFTLNNNRIFESEINLSDIYETKIQNDIVEISVLYRVTSGINTNMTYYLSKEDNMWKILSFKLAGEESVINNDE